MDEPAMELKLLFVPLDGPPVDVTSLGTRIADRSAEPSMEYPARAVVKGDTGKRDRQD